MVDDSPVMRRMITDVIRASAEFRVVAEAATGYEAIRRVHEMDPDIVTLDLEMPDLGGLDTLGYIMSEAPRPVVILSAHSAAGAEPTLQALDYGAVDFVLKPAGDRREGEAELAERLLEALRAASRADLANLPVRMPGWGRAEGRGPAAPADVDDGPHPVVAVAASTGGPRALADVVPLLPAALPAMVLVVQHMPPTFTRLLAQRLDEMAALPVREAEAGERLRPGRVYLAPGGRHLVLERTPAGVFAALEETEPVWGVRPAADPLFHSVARHYGPRSIGVVLTGMGQDGAAGLRAIREVGGWTVAQDRESSVIYGMPRAAAEYARAVLPLARIAGAVTEQVEVMQRTARRWTVT